MEDECGVKTCPQCGVLLFADMDVCYGCMYEFSKDTGNPQEDENRVPTEAYWDELTMPGQAEHTAPAYALKVTTRDADICVPLGQRGLTVGRGSASDVVLHARAVSRRHVAFTPRGNEVEVCDMGARNPAVLNGREVHGTQLMVVGDQLDVCGTLFRLVDAS